MDQEKIKAAIYAAIGLISDEVQSVCDDNLKEEYNDVLIMLNEAIEELER